MPQIRTILNEWFGRAPGCSIDPDLVVAMGAAIQGGLIRMDKAVQDIVITDVAPFTLGVATARDVAGRVRDGYFTPVISRNTTIPVSRVEEFCTLTPNQTTVTVRIYQGESRRVEDNLFLGEFELKGIPRGPAGQPLEIRFTYDLNGLLEVEAVASRSGVSASFVVTRHAGNMSQKDLNAAVKRMQDLKADPREEQVNRHLLKKAARVFQEVAPDIRPILESLISGFEEALELQDPSAIAVSRDALESLIGQLDPISDTDPGMA